MDFEFYFDPDIGTTHVARHGVTESEIYEFFTESLYLDHERADGSWIAIGRLGSGRYLEIPFRKKSKNVLFIITAYDITDPDYIAIVDGHLA